MTMTSVLLASFTAVASARRRPVFLACMSRWFIRWPRVILAKFWSMRSSLHLTMIRMAGLFTHVSVAATVGQGKRGRSRLAILRVSGELTTIPIVVFRGHVVHFRKRFRYALAFFNFVRDWISCNFLRV